MLSRQESPLRTDRCWRGYASSRSHRCTRMCDDIDALRADPALKLACDVGDQAIGEIDHLLIEKVSGRVTDAVMSFGGFLGPRIRPGEVLVQHSHCLLCACHLS